MSKLLTPPSQNVPCLTIDKFSDGDSFLAASALGQTPGQETLAPLARGNQRTVWLNVVDNPYGNQASVRVSNGVMSFNNDVGVYSTLEFTYGYTPSGPQPMGLDFTPYTHITMNFAALYQPAQVSVLLTTHQNHYCTWVGPEVPVGGPGVFKFSEFNPAPGFDWTKVDWIDFRFEVSASGRHGVDLAIDSIFACP